MSSSNHSRTLSHLSEKEKLQYLQLTKTRERIVEEFSKTTGIIDSRSFGTLPSSSSAKTRISKSSEAKKKSNANQINELLPPIRSGIMMLPILATSGEPAMGSSSIGKKLKLPIFKLPQIDSKQFMAEKMKLPSIITHSDHSVTHLTFLTYFDKKSFKKAMLSAVKSMTPNEKQFFTRFLSATETDVSEIIHEVERRVEHDNEPTFVNGRKCIFVQSDLFKPDYHCPSVFMVACEAAAERVSGAKTDAKKATNATLAATANLNLTSLGISPEFNNFIGTSSLKLSKTVGAKGICSGPHSAKSAASSSKRPRRLPPHSSGGSKANPDSSLALTKMLIESMSKMDRHANMIRKGMEEAQEIVDSKDANVKVVIFTVGAERMQVALYRITLIDKKRGFYAWKHFVRLEHRQVILKKFFQFLVIRNLAIGVSRLVSHILKSNLVLWKKNADAESHRLLREKIERSAILIQSIIRSRISYKKVNAIKMRRKYQKLYDATIKIQALIRGTVVKWRYQRSRVDRIQRDAATLIQRQIRGALARTKVQVLLVQYKRAMASKVVQRYVRGRQGRKRVKELQQLRLMNKCAVKIQKIVRGFVDRRTMTAKLIARLRYKHAVKIQALARGFITRNNMERKLAELQAFRDHRNHAATQIQAAYRGFHARLLFKMKLYQLRKVKAEQFRAATSIITMVRGFLCRAELRHLKKARLDQWIADAREWQEMWSDESSAWFYLHTASGEALWEPNRTGYTKFDGSLVLASGEIIPDPLMAKQLAIEDGEVDEEAEAEAAAGTKKNNKLCSECADRVAIRSCNECGDKFCTKCYKSTHATGSRRNHTYTNIGPIDCAECELLLAGRWCVSCDEAYCNACWKKVHSHGKRRFHPYSEVSNAGRIDSRIFTMDGEQLDGYDTSYNQQRSELERSTQHSSQMVEYGSTASTAAETSEGEWQEYADDSGYPYWYNTVTGASQYENPYGY